MAAASDDEFGRPLLEAADVDGDQSLVQITEGFRKAHRNTLVWSSICLLASLGMTESNTAVPLFPTGLEYPPVIIVIATYLVAIFMVLNYRRAEQIVRLRSSEMFLSKESSELANAFSELASVLQQKAGLLRDISIVIPSTRKALTAVESKLYHDTVQDVQILEQAQFNAAVIAKETKKLVSIYDHSKGVPEDGLKYIDQEFNLVAGDLNFNARQSEEAISDYRTKLERRGFSAQRELEQQSKKIEVAEVDLSEAIKKILVDTEITTAAAKRTGDFHKSISIGQRRWHFYLDRIPSYALFGVASLSFFSWFINWGSPIKLFL